jgi:hypothetical protein
MLKLTRRQAAAAISASVTALAQAQPPASTPRLPANPGEELQAAMSLLRDNAEQLARFPLPMSTEPAVRFKA